MKKLFTILLVSLILISCSKDDEEIKPSLTGTNWKAFNYKSAVDNEDVYTALNFISENQVERYSFKEKDGIIGDVETHSYIYNHPVITITIDETAYEGEVTATYIRVLDKDYSKY